jgi:hypothetical protein
MCPDGCFVDENTDYRHGMPPEWPDTFMVMRLGMVPTLLKRTLRCMPMKGRATTMCYATMRRYVTATKRRLGMTTEKCISIMSGDAEDNENLPCDSGSVPVSTKNQASIAQRKPKLPVDESGVLELRAATLYLLQ